tara:strand:+ start:2954 stop:5545 length:2592 start_codon:yes stop_codon:yes gene_type:complete
MIKKIDSNLKYTHINDYKPYDYSIPTVHLNFIIEDKKVKVIAELTLLKINLKTSKLSLKGSNIKIKRILLSGIELDRKKYTYEEEDLIIKDINEENFILKIEGEINPYTNTSLQGMYESNGIITTQCEAEGFRKITFHPDRPDILSKYLVRIEADKNKYPVLLSNGNLIKEVNLDKNRKVVIWEDPFPKPSYLFALVAGNLECIKDFYFTKTNKKILINIYVEKGDQCFVKHAIKSLKKAMRWDEEKYKLEYDLSLFNIVAIRHFNMGAMENKSLNIFNSKLVLADEKTSTDFELERVEGVIAHEYFHNWTGNRITCRDWFQLSLKEGLTVFRDQQFTSDMHSYEIKRIEDVKFLRKHQFREDSGPTSHPVKPEKYLEIDNFYTTTIYEKGSEIIRMAYAILKKEKFQKGFSDFIFKYDGQGATIDQFIDTIFKNNNSIDISKFKLWYTQNGTPNIKFKRNWDKNKRILSISISQNNKYCSNFNSLIIPIRIAIFTHENNFKEYLFILKENKEEFIVNNINTDLDKPIVTYFREFSAPVKWQTDSNVDEEIFILKNEKDLFTIYDSISKLYRLIINKRLLNKIDYDLENKLINTISLILEKNFINSYLLSEILNIPSFADLEIDIINIDPIEINKIIEDLNKKFALRLKGLLVNKINHIKDSINNEWPKGKDERKLIEVIWKLLSYTNHDGLGRELLLFIDRDNMTLSKSALNVFSGFDCFERNIGSKKFFNRWKDNSIVLDNWFYFVASIDRKDSNEEIENLFNHELFDPKSPNTLRSILNGFVQNNPFFHSKSGEGYFYIAEKVIEFDKLNPIVVSRFLKIFSNWKRYSDPYKTNMYNAIKYINSHSLSTNSREVIDLIMN